MQRWEYLQVTCAPHAVIMRLTNDPRSQRGEVIDLTFKRPVEHGGRTGAVRPDFSPLSGRTD